jgi:CBS domain-containing protein
MQCKDIMTRDIEVLGIDQPVHMAAAIMRDSDVGFLPVCDTDRRVVGTLTDRDITTRLVAAQRNSDTPVRDIMSPDVVSCGPTHELHAAEALMQQHHVSRLVCVNDDGILMGVVSVADLARRDDSEHVGATMQQIKSSGADLSA